MSVETKTLDLPGEAAATSRPASLYDRDFARWALREAALIRAGRLDAIDLENVAEEVESLGREQFGKVRGNLRVLLTHMLKWDHQPERRTRSWTLSIREARDQIDGTIEDSPSLKRRRHEAVATAYRGACLKAALETDLPLSTFPENCPYDLDEIMSRPIAWHDD